MTGNMGILRMLKGKWATAKTLGETSVRDKALIFNISFMTKDFWAYGTWDLILHS